jgi:hypothetical protein
MILIAVVAGLIVLAFLEGRAELEKGGGLEGPVEPPKRSSRNPAGEVVLTLDAESQARIGLRVEGLEASRLPREAAGFARVLDPASLITLLEEITSAEAQGAAARAEYERSMALHQSVKGVSQRAVEAAKAESIGKESRARAAASRLINAWGTGIASLPTADRDTLADRLVKREAALVRVDVPAGEVIESLPAGASIVPLTADGKRITANRIFDAPQVDDKIQGQGFLLYFESPSRALRPGAVMAAYLQLPGEPLEGVLIPRSAVVRLEGMSWVYVRGADDKFSRREVRLEQLLEKGWFTRSGFTAGDRVVVAEAQALLSEELRHHIQLEDE